MQQNLKIRNLQLDKLFNTFSIIPYLCVNANLDELYRLETTLWHPPSIFSLLLAQASVIKQPILLKKVIIR